MTGRYDVRVQPQQVLTGPWQRAGFAETAPGDGRSCGAEVALARTELRFRGPGHVAAGFDVAAMQREDIAGPLDEAPSEAGWRSVTPARRARAPVRLGRDAPAWRA